MDSEYNIKEQREKEKELRRNDSLKEKDASLGGSSGCSSSKPIPKQLNSHKKSLPLVEGELPHDESDADAFKLQIDVCRIIRGIINRKRTIVLIGVVIFAVGFAAVLLSGKQYTATAVILKKPEQSKLTVGEKANIKLQSYNAQTLVKVAVTMESYKEVIRQLEMDIPTWELAKKVEVDLPRGANAISIRAVDPDPAKAAKIANAFVGVIIDANIRMHTKEINKYLTQFQKKSRSERGKLDAVNSSILDFSEKNNVVNIIEEMKVYLQQLSSLDLRFDEEQMELSSVETKLKTVKEFKESDPEMAVDGFEKDGPLSMKLSRLEFMLADSKSKYTANNPKVIKLQEQTENLRNSINNISYERGVSLLERELQDRKIRINRLKESREKLAVRLSSLSKKEMEYQELLDQKEAVEKRYKHFSNVVEEAKLLKDGRFSDFQVASYASAPMMEDISKTKLVLVGIFLLFFASFSGIGVALIMELLNFKIITRKELELMFDFPILGDIEFIEKTGRGDCSAQEEGSLMSTFRTLTNNMFNIVSEKIKTIFVISNIPGEGKTFICKNLSKYLTKRSRRVIYFNLTEDNSVEEDLGVEKGDKAAGLTDYFKETQEMDVNLLIKKTNQEGLYYISRGGEIEDFLEWLDSQRMLELLRLLEAQFEFIVIDAPDIATAPELSMMFPDTPECSILVVESGRLKKAHILEGVEKLSRSNISINGIVLNKIPAEYMEMHTE